MNMSVRIIAKAMMVRKRLGISHPGYSVRIYANKVAKSRIKLKKMHFQEGTG